MNPDSSLSPGRGLDSPPVLSIVIPCFNSADTISRCLESIFAGEMEAAEVIVVDDGSTDDLDSALQEWARRGVRVVRQPRSGVSVARNTGIAASRGAFVMFVDADDRLVPEHLGAFTKFAIASDSDICVSDFIIDDGRSSIARQNINSARQEFGVADRPVLQRLCLVSEGFGGQRDVGLLGGPWAKIYSRRFLDRSFESGCYFTPAVTRSQDVLFNVEAFGRATSVTYFRTPTYVYAPSASSSSQRPAADYADRVGRLLTHLEGLIRRERWDHLVPPLARLRLIYFDEGVRRLGPRAGRRDVAALALAWPFGDDLVRTPLAELHPAGRIKVALLRLRLYGSYGWMTKGLFAGRRLRQALGGASGRTGGQKGSGPCGG